jgi:formylglycine-generating enzyme required for sulfatase activity
MNLGRMTKITRYLALFVVMLPFAARAAPDNERRVALVIGIGAYQNAPHLANPVNDARAIGDSLRRLKFDVTEVYDPDFRALNMGVREFGIRAANADVAVVYYAGHGVQVDRENYLIPADAKLERARDLLYEAMPLDRLLGEVSQARRIGIVLLDSCRNNPFIERVARSMTVAGRAVATTPGLARVDNVPRNTMVVMAAKADQIAEDGAGHSPFAAALLAHFQIPGLELSLFFRSVRDTVLRATNNRQEPYVFGSLGAEPFYFYPRPPNRPPEIAAITPLEVTEVAGPTPIGMPQPTDPDQDPLSIRIIGLPRFGEVRIEGRPAVMNSVMSAEHLKTAVYKQDGKTIGPAGTFDILVEDGRGGSVSASLPITVRSSHHPPVLGSGPGRVDVAQQFLGIPAPVSPDGDPLTVTINALPRGTVRNGAAIVRPGDHVTPDELSKLVFWPEAGFMGPAGSLRYTVDNGHGGVVEGSIDVVVGTVTANDASGESTVWDSLRDSTDPRDFTAFLRIFPASSHADEAKRRRKELDVAANAPAAGKADPATPQAKPVAEPSPSKPPEKPEKPAVVASLPPRIPPPDEPRPAPPVMTAANGPLVPVPSTPPRGKINDGDRFQDCPTCPRMVRIPAGSFMMGMGSHDAESMPAHKVDIHAFAIGEAPVTVMEWRACMAAKVCNFLPRMRVAEDRTPVHNLSWEDLGQYMQWLSTTTGHVYRLPSEAEWEYAAVGVSLANCTDCGGAQDADGPLPVDALPPNPFGLLDMLGGVAQWTADCWFPNYRGAPTDATPREARSCEKRVLRGGSFRSPHDEIAATYRSFYDAPVRYLVNGFRVARDLE